MFDNGSTKMTIEYSRDAVVARFHCCTVTFADLRVGPVCRPFYLGKLLDTTI